MKEQRAETHDSVLLLRQIDWHCRCAISSLRRIVRGFFVFTLHELNHAGRSVLAVIARMSARRSGGIHFFSVFSAFQFHFLVL